MLSLVVLLVWILYFANKSQNNINNKINNKIKQTPSIPSGTAEFSRSPTPNGSGSLQMINTTTLEIYPQT